MTVICSITSITFILKIKQQTLIQCDYAFGICTILEDEERNRTTPTFKYLEKVFIIKKDISSFKYVSSSGVGYVGIFETEVHYDYSTQLLVPDFDRGSRVRISPGARCCVLEQDTPSSLLSTGSTQENVPT